MNLSNYRTNQLIDGQFRGGALTSSGTAGSTAVVNKGIRTNNTAYSVGDKAVPNGVDTGAGGKFLVCTTAGTSQATLSALAIGNPGATVTDGSVTWTVVSGIPSDLAHYVALLVANKGSRANSTSYSLNDVCWVQAQGGANGDNKPHLYYCTTAGTTAASQPQYNGVDGEAITDGTAVFTELSPTLKGGAGYPAGLTEVSGNAYARVKVEAGSYPALSDWAATQGGSSSSTGTTATTSNSNAVTFPTSTGAWTTNPAQIAAFELRDQLTGGDSLGFGVLTTPQQITASGNTPSYAANQLTVKQDS